MVNTQAVIRLGRNRSIARTQSYYFYPEYNNVLEDPVKNVSYVTVKQKIG